MSETMLERCARAAEKKYRGLQAAALIDGTWKAKDAWADAIRAVLAVLREPDEGMIKAGEYEMVGVNGASFFAGASFRAMIDSILAEAK